MIALASGFAPGSDAGLSPAARFRHDSRFRNVACSASVSAQDRARTVQEILHAAHEAALDNWDEEGAAAVEQTTVRHTVNFVLALPQGVSSPSVLVDRDGDFAFDWGATAQRTFSVSVGRDGTLTYAGLYDRARTHGRENFRGSVPAAILAHIERASR